MCHSPLRLIRHPGGQQQRTVVAEEGTCLWDIVSVKGGKKERGCCCIHPSTHSCVFYSVNELPVHLSENQIHPDWFSHCHAHLAVGRQKAMVEGGTRISVKMGRYPAGRGGALCSSRSSTAPLMSLDTSPRTSSSTDTCSSLTGQKNNHDLLIKAKPKNIYSQHFFK